MLGRCGDVPGGECRDNLGGFKDLPRLRGKEESRGALGGTGMLLRDAESR